MSYLFIMFNLVLLTRPATIWTFSKHNEIKVKLSHNHVCVYIHILDTQNRIECIHTMNIAVSSWYTILLHYSTMQKKINFLYNPYIGSQQNVFLPQFKPPTTQSRNRITPYFQTPYCFTMCVETTQYVWYKRKLNNTKAIQCLAQT